VTRAAGFRLIVPPTVFHPRWFLTSEFFASFIAELDLSGKRVADIGTGSGILALTAARAGAASVVAIDVNPNAARAAVENAQQNGLSDIVSGVCSNLLTALAPEPLFDVILSSPPSFAGEPRDLADRDRATETSQRCSTKRPSGSRRVAACICCSRPTPTSTSCARWPSGRAFRRALFGPVRSWLSPSSSLKARGA
jgi:SAM-dependent methyltransferase